MAFRFWLPPDFTPTDATPTIGKGLDLLGINHLGTPRICGEFYYRALLWTMTNAGEEFLTLRLADVTHHLGIKSNGASLTRPSFTARMMHRVSSFAVPMLAEPDTLAIGQVLVKHLEGTVTVFGSAD